LILVKDFVASALAIAVASFFEAREKDIKESATYRETPKLFIYD